VKKVFPIEFNCHDKKLKKQVVRFFFYGLPVAPAQKSKKVVPGWKIPHRQSPLYAIVVHSRHYTIERRDETSAVGLCAYVKKNQSRLRNNRSIPLRRQTGVRNMGKGLRLWNCRLESGAIHHTVCWCQRLTEWILHFLFSTYIILLFVKVRIPLDAMSFPAVEENRTGIPLP